MQTANITESDASGKGKYMLSKPPRERAKSNVGRPRKYTREFLLSIPDLMIKDGLTLEQIAASVDGRPGAIIELCYKHKIALPSRRKCRIFARLRFATVKRMQAQAALRGLTYNELAEKLLEAVMDGNLVNAVLDD